MNILLLLIVVVAASSATLVEDNQNERHSKQLSIFQVVKFQNSLCSNSGGKNGTCYTREECETLGGGTGDSCAEGFGTCCVFNINCGQSSSQNLTYMAQDAFNSGVTSCRYTICAQQHICRIRFDFTKLTLAYPAIATLITEDAAAITAAGFAGAGQQQIYGTCLTDSLQIHGPSGSSPIICGPNNGQHVILDVTSGDCLHIDIVVGAEDSSTSRQWDITAHQYLCSDSLVAGPAGCLQWHTGTTGYLRSFGMPEVGSDIVLATRHMANHQYAICVRREVGYCVFCITPTAAGIQDGFGVSISPDAIAKSTVGTDCSTDYIELTGDIRLATAGTVINIAYSLADARFRHCGRFLGSAAAIASIEFCTRSTPYHVSVNFDDTEVLKADAVGGNAIMSENAEAPGGIMGFRLKYQQYNNICT